MMCWSLKNTKMARALPGEGVAFPHKDGLGMNVELRAMPVSGRLVIRRHDAKAVD